MQKIILSRHVVPMSGVLSQQTGTDGSIDAPRRGEMNSFSVKETGFVHCLQLIIDVPVHELFNS